MEGTYIGGGKYSHIIHKENKGGNFFFTVLVKF